MSRFSREAGLLLSKTGPICWRPNWAGGWAMPTSANAASGEHEHGPSNCSTSVRSPTSSGKSIRNWFLPRLGFLRRSATRLDGYKAAELSLRGLGVRCEKRTDPRVHSHPGRLAGHSSPGRPDLPRHDVTVLPGRPVP